MSVVADASMSGTAAPLATDPFLGQLPIAGKSIGHTSVAFKLTAANGAVAAFKPTSRRGGKRWLGEIAAYRMATELGLTNVPPAFGHVFARGPLHDALDPSAMTLFDAQVMTDEAGAIEGALIPWVKDLEFPAVERSPLFAAWTTALRHDAPLPAADSPEAALAAQMSTLVIFDLLDANWDRWSGGNVGQLKGTNTYLYIDNDGAFFAHPPEAALTRAWARFAAIDRFSASFVARLRAFGAPNMGNVLEPDVLAQMDQRKSRILKAIDDKIARYGESSVLVFR